MRPFASFLCAFFILLAPRARAEDVFDAVARNDYPAAIAAAQASGDALLETYAQWAGLRDPAAPPIAFAEGAAFLNDHPDWPDQNLIRLRTEEAALDLKPDQSVMHSFCATAPISGRGMIACTMAEAGTAEQRAQWISQGWRQGDFSDYEEALILTAYGHELSAQDHVARIDRLLFEGKIAEARRMLTYVPRERTTLYLARMALISNAKEVTFRLNAVPVNLAHDPGLLFDRIGWHHRKGEDAQVIALFMQAPADPPFADLWWPLRSGAVRDAFAAGHYKEAVRILESHGALKPEQLADALFLRGWIALTYLHDPHGAYKDFFHLYTASGTMMSKARAAYWAAEAARQNGNDDIAAAWRAKAAQRPTVFYGQLAFEELHPGTPLPLPPEPPVAAADEHSFQSEELVRLIKLLAAHHQKDMADHFLTHLASDSDEPSRFVLLARLARAVGQPEGGVRVAKLALRKGIILIKEGWPVIDIPPSSAVEPALALSIIRQESEFDPAAASPAGARGLMQLVPSTASLTARHAGMAYDEAALWQASANVALGTEYLGHLVRLMNDSYVLGIAAYNAGPGRVHQWENAFGEPGHSPRDSVNWIENIPFGETRNYVMRTMENIEIYRALLTPGAKLQIAENLSR